MKLYVKNFGFFCFANENIYNTYDILNNSLNFGLFSKICKVGNLRCVFCTFENVAGFLSYDIHMQLIKDFLIYFNYNLGCLFYNNSLIKKNIDDFLEYEELEILIFYDIINILNFNVEYIFNLIFRKENEYVVFLYYNMFYCIKNLYISKS